MSDKPIKISRYIQLITKEPLDKAQKSAWMNAVRQNAPSGTVATVQTTDDHGALKSVCMVHKEGKRKNGYQIPLTRDLSPDEVQKIVDSFSENSDLDNWDIETNETTIQSKERSGINVDDERHLAICTAMAKQRHDRWMKDHLNNGWRYGINFNNEEKTHPLLRPWEQLPDEFKKPDMESPQALLDLIQANGFVIVGKDDLERLVQKSKTKIPEAAVMLPHGQRVIVAKNPTPQSLISMLKKSKSNHLRGLVFDNSVYFWDAHDAIHADIAHVIGHDEYVEDRLDMRMRHGEPCIDSDFETYTQFHKNSGMMKLFGSNDLYFYVEGHGWLPGPQWLKVIQSEI